MLNEDIWEGRRVLQVDAVDESTIVRLYLMPLSCTLKMAKIMNFVTCILAQ